MPGETENAKGEHMDYIIKSIGILMAVVGVVMSTVPGLALKFVAWAKQGKRAYMGGVVRIVLGALLIWASPVATTMWIPLALGVLMVVAGALVFVLGIERVHRMLTWWESKSEEFRRAWAVAAAVIGVLIIYSA